MTGIVDIYDEFWRKNKSKNLITKKNNVETFGFYPSALRFSAQLDNFKGIKKNGDFGFAFRFGFNFLTLIWILIIYLQKNLAEL